MTTPTLTLEERAREWLHQSNHEYCSQASKLPDRLSLTALLAQIQREEREACAWILEQNAKAVHRMGDPIFGPHVEQCFYEIAESIRARPGGTGKGE